MGLWSVWPKNYLRTKKEKKMNSNFKSARNLNCEWSQRKEASFTCFENEDRCSPKARCIRHNEKPFVSILHLDVGTRNFPSASCTFTSPRNAVLSVTNNSLTNSPSLPRPTASIHPNKKENKAIKTFLFGSRFPQLDGSMALGWGENNSPGIIAMIHQRRWRRRSHKNLPSSHQLSQWLHKHFYINPIPSVIHTSSQFQRYINIYK